MADGTKIEWTDATVNAINGCSVISPGCTNCYAMRLAGTRLKHHPSRVGLTIDSKAGPVWNGEVRLNEDQLLQPLRWTKPRQIFWNAHGDMFHPSVPKEWIDRCFAVMAMTPQHIHQVLTKRADRMRTHLSDPSWARFVST
jgi:protein gp37